MSNLPTSVRKAEQLIHGIAQTVHDHRTRFFSEPTADGFRVFLSLNDAQNLDEQVNRQGDFTKRSELRDGDTGVILGLPFTIDASLQSGQAYVGYRIIAPEVQP